LSPGNLSARLRAKSLEESAERLQRASKPPRRQAGLCYGKLQRHAEAVEALQRAAATCPREKDAKRHAQIRAALVEARGAAERARAAVEGGGGEGA
jgi:regulator of sirC expression with transglutaminase-like and TPR domain